MTDVVYLMGAGASFGKRGKEDLFHKVEINSGDAVSTSYIQYANILEGMPLVIEIPQRILYICDLIKNSDSTTDFYVTQTSFEFTKDLLVKDLMWLYDGAIKHATIDTFAKKLFLTGRVEEYNKLKKMLAIYFIIEQVINKPDSRYDTFLANILTTKLEIPDRIRILTWNYDSQFEIAFNEYKKTIITPKDIGCYSIHDNEITKSPAIFKINGTASFNNWNSLANFRSNHKLNKRILDKIIYAYKDNESLLSFAWETSKKKSDDIPTIKTAIEQIKEARILVVVGYTFPFFNRIVDKSLISSMDYLNKIYIQDPRANEIMQNVDAVLPVHKKRPYEPVEIIPITNCDQFYLPPEL